MRTSGLGMCCAVLVTVLGSAAFAQDDFEKGAEIAREICVRCHHIEPGGPFKEYPPSFASIAVYRSDEQIFGRIMFPPLHSGMPEVAQNLSRGIVDQLVAYIRSLETR